MKVYLVILNSDNGGQEFFLEECIEVFKQKKPATAFRDHLHAQHVVMFGKEVAESIDLQLIEKEVNQQYILRNYKCLLPKDE